MPITERMDIAGLFQLIPSSVVEYQTSSSSDPSHISVSVLLSSETNAAGFMTSKNRIPPKARDSEITGDQELSANFVRKVSSFPLQLNSSELTWVGSAPSVT